VVQLIIDIGNVKSKRILLVKSHVINVVVMVTLLLIVKLNSKCFAYSII